MPGVPITTLTLLHRKAAGRLKAESHRRRSPSLRPGETAPEPFLAEPEPQAREGCAGLASGVTCAKDHLERQ